jgi:hypothetical protein
VFIASVTYHKTLCFSILVHMNTFCFVIIKAQLLQVLVVFQPLFLLECSIYE